MVKDERQEQQAKRLRLARENAGYKSGRTAALRRGWVYTTYAAHESGNRGFPASVAEKYAAAFNVHPDFLLFGTRPPAWWSNVSVDRVEPASGRRPVRYLRFFVSDSVAEITAYLSNQIEVRGQYPVVDTDLLPPRAFALQVATDEMNPRVPVAGDCSILPEDVVLVDPNPEAKPGDIVVLKVVGDPHAHLRKVRFKSASDLEFVALNDGFGPLDATNAAILGRVIVHVRRL